jgi:hypothetical protein
MENLRVISADSRVVEPTDLLGNPSGQEIPRPAAASLFGAGMRGTLGDLGVSRLIRTSHVIAS